MLGSRQVTFYAFNETERNEILHEFFSHGGRLSVPDASVVYLARKTGSRVLAFDEKIVKAVKKGR